MEMPQTGVSTASPHGWFESVEKGFAFARFIGGDRLLELHQPVRRARRHEVEQDNGRFAKEKREDPLNASVDWPCPCRR
jgi:hypothetical protein